MSTVSSYPHITADTNGAARIGNTRYKVIQLAAEQYHYGWSAEELLRQHPDLKPEEVYAALTYFYDHYKQMVAEIQTPFPEADWARTGQSLSRAELLKRGKAESR